MVLLGLRGRRGTGSGRRPGTGPRPEQARGQEDRREQALDWVKANNAFGPTHELVKDVKTLLDGLTAERPDFAFEFGADLTKSMKETWLVGWRDRFWAFELTAAQSAGREKGRLLSIALERTNDNFMRRDFEIQPPKFAGGLPADRDVVGKLPTKNLGRTSTGFPSVRLVSWRGKERQISFSHRPSSVVGKEETEFAFKLPPPDMDPGPAIFLFEMIEYPDAERTGKPVVVSNPAAMLVDITPARGPAPAPVPPPTPKGVPPKPTPDKPDPTPPQAKTDVTPVPGKKGVSPAPTAKGVDYVRVAKGTDWKAVPAAVGVKAYTNRDYKVLKLPKELQGAGVLQRAGGGEGDTGYPSGQVTLTKPATIYVAVMWKYNGERTVSDEQFAAFAKEGWAEAAGEFVPRFPPGEDWKWRRVVADGR